MASAKLEITIENFEKIPVFLDKFTDKALVTAVRRAQNVALRKLVTRTSRVIRQKRKLKAKEIKDRFFKIKKAKGNMLSNLEASLTVDNRSVSLIRHVVGKKEGRSQRGIPVSKRKPVRVEITPGKRIKLKTAFIAKGRNNRNHVFRRRQQGPNPIVKQSAPALSKIVAESKVRRKLNRFAQNEFTKEFERVFELELQKLVK